MKPDEFLQKYIDVTAEKSVYINSYVMDQLGFMDLTDEVDEEKFNEQANELIEDLVLKYEDEIDIRIK